MTPASTTKVHKFNSLKMAELDFQKKWTAFDKELDRMTARLATIRAAWVKLTSARIALRTALAIAIKEEAE